MPICTLEEVKTRLSIAPADTTFDALLSMLITEVAARFDEYCGRKLEFSEGRENIFSGDCISLTPDAYPVSVVNSFELQDDWDTGWTLVAPAPKFQLQGNDSLIILEEPVGAKNQQLRLNYDGGFVFPGAVPGAGQTALPLWVKHAAINQIAQSYQLRTQIGVSKAGGLAKGLM